ncbi:hypothetical protein HPB48_001503 [Haemaphysalis longicornis]|uniref:diphosphoinositol-polyphosphate diphosphatase n=1 Tax=Haemaphysalis longicornis TaxID=44386 RepID=A0A9J6FF10_HAELO|nr:hypothetical protein HPB48_001503 [Haemaphysalis longicornis]
MAPYWYGVIQQHHQSPEPGLNPSHSGVTAADSTLKPDAAWLRRTSGPSYKRVPHHAEAAQRRRAVLQVSSSSAPHRWIGPGGGLEPNEEPSAAALREDMEEGGVRGRLGRCLGTFENLERKHLTMVFILEVTEELEEWEDSKNIGRKRNWFPIDEALRVRSTLKPVLCNYVKLLIENEKMP